MRDELLEYYTLVPFLEHPYWVAVRAGKLSLEQVLRAETQHYLRTRAGQALRHAALTEAKGLSQGIFESLLETYLEECTQDATGPSHLDLIKRLLLSQGVTEEDLGRAVPEPGNAAAIALYTDIGRRGSGCHLLGAGAVEHYYCQLSPQVFEAYTTHYGMKPDDAETYRIHTSIDQTHANRAFANLDEAIRVHGASEVRRSVRDAFIATSLHYDGMMQAATGRLEYWGGSS